MRQRIFLVITDDRLAESDEANAYDWFMIAVITLSLLPLCFKEMGHALLLLEWACTAVFVVDYILRWICADLSSSTGDDALSRAQAFALYPFTPLAIVDLVSIVPTFAHVSQALRLSRLVRLLRVMRVVKLVHHSRSIQLVLRVLKRERDALIAVMALSVGYVLISALVIFNVEPDTFETFFDALYWAVISLSTIGYGDICAHTVAGRAVSMVSAFVGIAMVALPSGIITAGFVEELRGGGYEDEEL